MKISHLILPIALAFATVNTATAQTTLVESKNCVLCHSSEKTVVGPSFKAISAKYRGDKDAPERLVLIVLRGGSGIWGKTAMPANPQVSSEEAKTLVAWILDQK
jgi:cytochrome c